MLFYPTVHVIPKTVYHIWNIEGNKRRKGISPYVNNIFLNRHENVSATRALPPLKKIFRTWAGNREIPKAEWDLVIRVRNHRQFIEVRRLS